MPITVTAPRGVLTPAGEREILPRLTDALLEASEAKGNPFFTSIVGGSVHLLDPQDIYAGGKASPVVMVELKLPDIGLDTVGSRAAFITFATRIVEDLTGPEHDNRNTWVNILNAPSGAWGIGGLAYTGDKLRAAATASTQS
jgi:phenylpyruvate tautomerase PptA (4-oxalocrotonate tautomerase family)